MNPTEPEKEKAVILLSGGLDSATCLAIAAAEDYACYALTFRYGQRHSREVNAAAAIAKKSDIARHLVLTLGLDAIGGSALTTKADIPKGRTDEEMASGIPSTYVPARNTIFLSYALAWAEALGCADIFIGVNAIDYSGYPDCRPEFIESFEKTARLGTRMGTQEGRPIRIHTPLIGMTKAEIIKKGVSLGVDYSMTHSCYDPLPDDYPCGHCDSCKLRRKGFEEAGLRDPLEYIS
jgi:7-cyano-7-deazaguanine synthase